MRRRQGPQDERDHDERECIDDERGPHVAEREDHAADRRPDDVADVLEAGPGAVGWPELPLVFRQRRQVRAECRVEEGRSARGGDRERRDKERRTANRDEDGHEHHQRASEEIRYEQDEPSIEAVGDDSGRDG